MSGRPRRAAHDLGRLTLEGGLGAVKRRIRAAVAPLAPQAEVLDVGCGTGLLRGAVGGHTWTGLDTDSGALERARGRLRDGDRLVSGGAAALPFPSHRFDLVVCHGLLHHLDPAQLNEALSEMARVCRGQLLLLDPVRDGAPLWRRALYRADGGRWIRHSEHLLDAARPHMCVVRSELFRSGVNRKVAMLATPRR